MATETHSTRTEPKPRVVGINQIALEVGDLEEALAFYGRLFSFTLRGRNQSMAFIELGDQFIALVEQRTQPPDRHRHFGLVVEDRHAVREALQALGVKLFPGQGVDFLDPWGNRVQIVQYSDIQFTKAPHVLKGMGLDELQKSAQAIRELTAKGMAPE
jgi:lactoylglutathione lyase